MRLPAQNYQEVSTQWLPGKLHLLSFPLPQARQQQVVLYLLPSGVIAGKGLQKRQGMLLCANRMKHHHAKMNVYQQQHMDRRQLIKLPLTSFRSRKKDNNQK